MRSGTTRPPGSPPSPQKPLDGTQIFFIILGVIAAIFIVLYLIALIFVSPFYIGQGVVNGFRNMNWSWKLLLFHQGVLAIELGVVFVLGYLLLMRRYPGLKAKEVKWIVSVILGFALALLASTEVDWSIFSSMASMEILTMLYFSSKLVLKSKFALALVIFVPYSLLLLLGVFSLLI